MEIIHTESILLIQQNNSRILCDSRPQRNLLTVAIASAAVTTTVIRLFHRWCRSMVMTVLVHLLPLIDLRRFSVVMMEVMTSHGGNEGRRSGDRATATAGQPGPLR